MKKHRLWPLVFLSVVLLPPVMIIWNYWPIIKYLLPSSLIEDTSMIDPSKEIMHVAVDSYVADIPANYFWQRYMLRGSWWHAPPERLTGDHLNLKLRLPRLEPWTSETSEEFEKPGGSTIRVALSRERNPDWPFRYFKNVRQRLELMSNSNEAPGLLHFRDTVTGNDVFLEYDEPKKNMVQIFCRQVNEADTFGFCWYSNSSYREHFNLSCRYPRRFLYQWREIDTGLKKLFDSFAIKNN